MYSENNQHWPGFTFFLAKILKTNKSPATDKLTEKFPSTFQQVLIKISSLLGPSLWTTLHCLFHLLSRKGATPLLWDLRMHTMAFLRPKDVSLAEEGSTVVDKNCFSHN